MTDIRYSQTPVQVGQFVFVGCGDGSWDVKRHEVTSVENPRRIHDVESPAGWSTSYAYHVRLAE